MNANAEIIAELRRALNERDEAREQLDLTKRELGRWVDREAKAVRERDEARAEVERRPPYTPSEIEWANRIAIAEHQSATEYDARKIAERERDEARAERDNLLDTRSEGAWMARALDAERMAAEAEKLSDAAKAAWDAECIMREQRDRFHAEWKQERQEVERLRRMLPVHPSSLTDACTDAYIRGAEAMRARCEELVKHNSHEDGIGMGSQRIESAIRALTIPEEP